jgi:hypothetical protein
VDPAERTVTVYRSHSDIRILVPCSSPAARTEPLPPSGTSTPQPPREFHISKPDGWPPGEYQVEIMLDGRTVDTLDFEVGG